MTAMQSTQVTHQEQQALAQVVVTPGVHESVFTGNAAQRMIVYNEFDLESVFAAAILMRHFTRALAKPVTLTELNIVHGSARHLWVGLNNTSKLQSFFRTQSYKGLHIQSLAKDSSIPVDDVGVGPSLLTVLSEEFGIRTERYERLFYRAQRFYRKDTDLQTPKVDVSPDLEFLAYVYKNARYAFECLCYTGESFTPVEATQEDREIYLRDFKHVQEALSQSAKITPGLDGHTQVQVASFSLNALPMILAKRLLGFTGTSYFNRVSNHNGTMIFTDLVKPVLQDPDDKVVIVNC